MAKAAAGKAKSVGKKVSNKPLPKAKLTKVSKSNAKVTAGAKSDIVDKSLSPVIIRPTRNAKAAPKENTKSVERVIDIREIKKQAEKIIQEKKLNKTTPLGSLRVSPRKKDNVSTTPTAGTTPQNTRTRGKAVIQTISDGPTVSLLSQNKIIQKNLPKNLRKVQKQLLKTQKENPKKSPLVKKSNLLKGNDKVRNQELIQKLTKLLLKNKSVTKAQLNNLIQNKSDFKAITALVGLLKAKRKASAEVQKNKWQVCVKEEEEDEEMEEEEEESFEVDDEDQDKSYVPPAAEPEAARRAQQFPRPQPAPKATPTPKHRMITPLKPHSNVKSNKSYSPIPYRIKPNRLADGDTPLYPIDEAKHLLAEKGILAPSKVNLNLHGKTLKNASNSSFDDGAQDESIHSISTMIERTKAAKESAKRLQEHKQGNKEYHYCYVCKKSYFSKKTALTHSSYTEEMNLEIHEKTWLHKFQANYLEKNSPGAEAVDQDQEKRDKQLISQIKKEMVRTMSAQMISPPLKTGKGGAILFKPNMSSHKYILDSELNLSLVVDSLNLILTNDVEDDEDAYDTLQMALGASNSDMEVLKHLAGQTITTDYVYDSNNPKSNEGTFDPSESALLIEEYRHDQVDIDMETRALGCPSPECAKTFFGLIGLQTHIKYWHRNEVFLQKKTTYRFLHGPEPLKYVCFVCKEMFLNASSRDDHITACHRPQDERNNEAKAKLVDAFREILEGTLKKCVDNEERARNKKREGKLPSHGNASDGTTGGADGTAEGASLDAGEEGGKKEEVSASEVEFDEYDDMTLMGADFIRKLKGSEDGLRAYNLLVQLVNPTESTANLDFINHLIGKLQTIFGKVVKSSLLPISNQIVISSRQQHNVYNSDSRARTFVCPGCECRFLTAETRNKHFAKAHPEVKKEIDKLDQASPGSVRSTDRINALLEQTRKGHSLHSPGINALLEQTRKGHSLHSPAESVLSTGSESSAPLDKTAVLNELKIRMAKRANKSKVAVKREEEEEEEEMLELEDEFLVGDDGYMEEEEQVSQVEERRETRGSRNLQQVIREIQDAITPLRPPKSPRGGKSPRRQNNKCVDCNRVFINEDELFHHNRLEHSERSLVSQLSEFKKKPQAAGVTTPSELPSLGVSPVKAVQVTANLDTSITPVKQLAPLLTRKELSDKSKEKLVAAVSEVMETDAATEVIDEAAGTVTNVVKIGSRQLVMQRTTRGSAAVSSPRKIMMSPEGNIDKVLQRDGSCLIEYEQGSPVSVDRLDNASGAKRAAARGNVANTTPGNIPKSNANTPVVPSTGTKPVLKTPLASKLVSKLCSALKINIPSDNTAPVSDKAPPTQEKATPPPNAIKPGPRTTDIDEETRRKALALIRELGKDDRRKKKRKNVTERKEDSGEESEEEVYLEEEQSGLLLSNSQSWKRVADVVKEDWDSSDDD